MTLPVGLRNGNPGNVRYTGTQWMGLADPPSDGTFCRFIRPEYGLRVIATLLLAYQRTHNLHTVREMIHRWAPPTENDSDTYAATVAAALGVGVDDAVDASDPLVMGKLMRAIVHFENGVQPYDDEMIAKALGLAGLAT